MASAKKTNKTAKAAETEKKSLAERRRQKVQRLANASKVTFSLEPDVQAFFKTKAREAGMEVGHYMQKVVETHILDVADKDDPLATRLKAKRAVIDTAVKLAQDMDEDGGFDENFILSVMKKASKDAEFKKLYAKATQSSDKEGKQATRATAPLNQQLGRLIKKAVGAKSKRNDAGKIARAQVTGEMISTYTLLEKAA